MSTRTFLSCDFCNPQGVRFVEQRRRTQRPESGGRATDGRAWFDGDVKKAVAFYGWKVVGSNKHACPRCVADGKSEKNPFPTLQAYRRSPVSSEQQTSRLARPGAADKR